MTRTMRNLVGALSALALTMVSHATALAHGSTLGEGLRIAGANPFHGETTLAFRINHGMPNVDLSVFDVSGRRVAQLVNGSLDAGEHRVEFSGRGLPVGTSWCV